jgi:serine/threonine-protein kinase
MQRESTRAASPELQIGEVFAGHRIDGMLGRGGMGVVYQATDLRLNRMAALKVITPALSADEDFRRRFQRESQLAASVRQPNVVTIFQAGEADGLLFVTMELIHGMDLRALIKQRGRLDLTTASAIVTQIAAALDAAHAAGLVHRDVKPGNVLIAQGASLHVYLTDFGLTKRTSSQSGITKTGLFVGTIDYAAPEQIKGWPVDARADVYALGCMLFEMVAGQPPFRRENEYATMYAHASEPPPPLSSAAAGVPPALNAVVARALAKEPDARQPSAGDLGRAVASAIAGQALAEPERTVAIGRAAPGAPPPPETPSQVPTVAAPAGYAPTAPAAPPVTPQPHPAYGYGMDPQHVAPPPGPPSYPTSVLPPSRNPWIVVAIVAAVLLVAGGVAAALLLKGDDSPRTTQVSQPPVSTPPADTGNANRDAALRKGVGEIAAVLDLSQEGRTLTIDRDYTGAIKNRQKVLDTLDGLTLPPQLRRQRALLRAAVQASLDADRALAACETCAGTQIANLRATRLKQRFVRAFNPLATRYLQRSFDSNSL